MSPDKSLSHDKVSNVSDIPEMLRREWIINHKKYKHLFQGIGCFKCTPISIEIQEGSIPVSKPARKVPLALHEKFKQEINSMVKAGKLAEVTPEMSTLEWLNSFVIMNQMAILEFVIHPVCNIRTLEEIIDMLKGYMYFAVFNSTKSFFHVPLDHESKQLMVMLTPIGIYLYNVLTMGLSNATDIFKKYM